MSKNNRDIATVFGDAYSKSCPKVLGDQHNFLLDALESHALHLPAPALLVLGCGGQALPYSCQYTPEGRLGESNRERIRNLVKDGKIILLDYIDGFYENGLIKTLNTLAEMGFFDKGYFEPGRFVVNKRLNPADLEKRTISFIKNNLRDSLRISDNSVAVADANLSIHHASVTRAELERVYREIFRILQPGGMLHLGEGNVDMNYSEDKIIRIGEDLSSILKSDVVVVDERNRDYVVHALFEKGRKYDRLPVSAPLGDYFSAKINKDGMVVINHAPGMEDELKSRGYRQMVVQGNCLSLPLIDPEMPEDFDGLVMPVDKFYDAIKKRQMEYEGTDDALVARIFEGTDNERNYARKGIVEHYMGERRIINALGNAGFEEIKVKHHEKEPFYNITAKKPGK